MSLTASMWTGISGLMAHGERMNVLGNNIANVNTIGFKGARMDFEDFIYQDQATASGLGQVGRGVAIGAIMSDFGQGSFETTTESTDLAIGGNGFFEVKMPDEDTTYYTRAGNFRFDKEGFLVDPHGYRLQGWEIPADMRNSNALPPGANVGSSSIRGTGVPVDIQLDGFASPPKHTKNVTMVMNLDAVNGGDNTQPASGSGGNKFTALFDLWDGSATEPIGERSYAYQNTIKVYDEGGTAHNLTVYFDQVSNSGDGRQYWEYIVTIDPNEDNRSFYSNGAWQSVQGTAGAGLLMGGTLEFDSAGQLQDMSAFTVQSNASPGDLKNHNNWGPAAFSQDGYPIFAANFSGQINASYTTNGNNAPALGPSAESRWMELNLGLRNPDTNWDNNWSYLTNPGMSMADIDSIYPYGMPSFGSDVEPESLRSTSYSGSSATQFQSQDGYTYGFLQNVTVDRDGILQGRYSNGEILDLYQIPVYTFQSQTNLRREGGNLFSETRESGQALRGPANANGNGTIQSNSLEQSNVDLSREFVNMITTQRGFQANSKVITTTDTMLGEVIALKR